MKVWWIDPSYTIYILGVGAEYSLPTLSLSFSLPPTKKIIIKDSAPSIASSLGPIYAGRKEESTAPTLH